VVSYNCSKELGRVILYMFTRSKIQERYPVTYLKVKNTVVRFEVLSSDDKEYYLLGCDAI
jgi:hypothetical protein